jgi:maltose alpha-D-glucosyltransferase/alpha-amylase
LKQLQEEVLPEFLRPRRWFAGKGAGLAKTQLGARVMWNDNSMLALIDVQLDDGTQQRYFLPLALAWEDGQDSGALRTVEWTLAKVREHSRVGVLVDAFADPAFSVAVASCIAAGTRLRFDGGELRFEATLAFPADAPYEPVQHLGREQSNTSVVLGERLFLKGYRQARDGVNPDVEVARYLTQAGYRHIAALTGSVEYHRDEGPPITLIALFEFVRNQGDGWTYALNHLDRYETFLPSEGAQDDPAPHALFLTQMRTLGRRVGELHAVLSTDTDDPAFKPEATSPADLSGWREGILAEAQATLISLEAQLQGLPETIQTSARQLLDSRQQLMDLIRQLANVTVDSYNTRYHGDLHLGQVLIVADDFLITDFEGEPSRPMEERRCKGSVLRDVAGMLRSFDYARAAATDRALTVRPDSRERIEAAFETWRRESCVAFLKGYHKGVARARCVTTKTASTSNLIALFQIEKALYELRYELNNRPAWIGIPINGLLTLCSNRGQ